MGQPILVGHHSERRHRRDLERWDRAEGKWIEAEKETERRGQLAENIRAALEKGDNPVTIRLRIERHEASIRDIDRKLARDDYRSQEWYPEWAEQLTYERARLAEAVEIDRGAIAALEASGAVVTYGRHNVKPGDYVKALGTWHKVVRANAKSATVPSIVGGSWTDTLPWAKVTGHRPADG